MDKIEEFREYIYQSNKFIQFLALWFCLVLAVVAAVLIFMGFFSIMKFLIFIGIPGPVVALVTVCGIMAAFVMMELT